MEESLERAAPMKNFPNGTAPSTSSGQLLLAYVADLELEVDRLRKHSQFVQHEVRGSLKRIQALCADAVGVDKAAPALAEIQQTTKQLGAVLRDLQEPSGYHPSHDQVVAIAVRPLAEQVFRCQQRLEGALDVSLQFSLEHVYVEWFP